MFQPEPVRIGIQKQAALMSTAVATLPLGTICRVRLEEIPEDNLVQLFILTQNVRSPPLPTLVENLLTTFCETLYLLEQLSITAELLVKTSGRAVQNLTRYHPHPMRINPLQEAAIGNTVAAMLPPGTEHAIILDEPSADQVRLRLITKDILILRPLVKRTLISLVQVFYHLEGHTVTVSLSLEQPVTEIIN